MRTGSRPFAHAGDRPRAATSVRRTVVLTVLAALATAALVEAAGGGDAFWLGLPVALLLTALSPSPLSSVLSAATVIAAALAAAAQTTAPGSVALALLVPAASVAVFLTTRERLVSEREALRISAATDPLTGAANRRSLLGRIDYEIARHRRSRRSFALVMLDLDGFKQLNDRFGHAAGDDLLCDVAAALQSAIRDQDTVARIGGDEFCVLAPETDSVGARKLAGRVMTAVGRVTAGIDALGASPGMAVFPHDGASATALLEAADAQMIDVKRRRRGARTRRRAA
jgi:diguanylate cyclase (GGDEF)-like protein